MGFRLLVILRSETMGSKVQLMLLAAVVACAFAVPQPQKRNIIENPRKLWEYGVVPVEFDDSVDGFTLEKLFASMQEVQFSTFSGARSCVSFVPRESEENYLVFSITEGTIGESTPGKAGGRQV